MLNGKIVLTKERASNVENIFEHKTESGVCYSVYLKTTDDAFWCDDIWDVYRVIDSN